MNNTSSRNLKTQQLQQLQSILEIHHTVITTMCNTRGISTAHYSALFTILFLSHWFNDHFPGKPGLAGVY